MPTIKGIAEVAVGVALGFAVYHLVSSFVAKKPA